MTTITGSPVLRDRGHPLLALFCALAAIALVATATWAVRNDETAGRETLPQSAVEQPASHSTESEVVFYIVSTPQHGDAILQAEANAGSDAQLLGGQPRARNVQILLVQSWQDETNVALLLHDLEGVQIVDTRASRYHTGSSDFGKALD